MKTWLGAALAGPVAGQVTEYVSLDSLEGHGVRNSEYASISADGRYVAFWSKAANLVHGDSNRKLDVFVRDRWSGTTERVSVDSLGVQGDSDSVSPSISTNGRYVAFWSMATNLVVGDSNGLEDVFVRDRQSGTTERVSVDSLETQGNSHSLLASISADGRYVAFTSMATNLVVGDSNGWEDVFVRDRWSGTTERVSVDSGGAEGNSSSGGGWISADGRYVAFLSQATNLVSGDTNGWQDVFVRDRWSGTTERVSVDSGGMQGNSYSSEASISADGLCVAFASFADNLVSGDTNGHDVFVHDRQSGSTERVSVDSGGMQGNGNSRSPSISADGRQVAFTSMATKLVAGDTNGNEDVFVHDRQSNTTERVSVDSGGMQANASCTWPSISADGRYVAFTSSAFNLAGGDTNGAEDVFVRDRCSAATSAIFAGDGINLDTIAPVSANLGSAWSAPLTLGHPHGVGGPLVLHVRTATINGQDFPSPLGGRPAEVLITGPLLGTFSGVHNGVSGGVLPMVVPPEISLVGFAWAAQYTVSGGGFVDLSRAVTGIIDCP